MREWIAEIVGEDMATGAMLIVVTLAIVLAFMLLFAIFKGFSGTGVRSTKRGRQARLAVMDAAIVDSRRRLVLIRRDDTEHLLLIGGPTDVVVEQNINRQHQTKSTKTQHPRSQPAPIQQNPTPTSPPAREIPVAQPIENPAPRVPAPPAFTEKPNPVQSPQIRPVTKPPEPAPAPVAVTPPPPKPAPVAPVSTPAPAELPSVAAAPKPAIFNPPPAPAPISATPPAPKPAPVAAIQTPPAQAPISSPALNTVSNAAMAGLGGSTSRSSSRGPVLAQASASSVAAAQLVTAAAPASPPPAIDTADDVAENQLADFEDNLAMNLGETLVQEAKTADKDSLASEMDELLSEITSSGKS